MNRAFKEYRTVQTITAPGLELVLMLYRGGIKFLNSAVAALERQEIEQAHNALVRAQDIVRELRTTLDAGRGGELATELERLYLYCEERLLEANLHKDPKAAIEVRVLLQELAAAWEGVKSNAAARAGGAAAVDGLSG